MYAPVFCRFNKTVLVEGEKFSRPELESLCCVGIAESESQPADIDSVDSNVTCQLNLKKDVKIGSSEDCRSAGIESMLMSMKAGETSHFHVWWEHRSTLESEKLYHHHKSDQPSQEQHITISLYSFSPTKSIWQLSCEEKYELSLLHKNSGTRLFQDDKIEAAFHQFSVALKYLISVLYKQDISETERERYKKLKCICHINMAACQLKYDDFDSVIENCTKGLSLDPWNVKGLYRRAAAYKAIGKVDQARTDLIKVVKKEPKNRIAADLLESLMPLKQENKT